MKKMLILAPFPYGKNALSGGALLCKNELIELNKNYDITVVSIFHNDEILSISELNSQYADVGIRLISIPIKLSKLHVLLAKVKSLFLISPEHPSYFTSKHLDDVLLRMSKETKFDVIMCQFPVMAQYIDVLQKTFSDAKTIIDVQDVYSVSWYRRYKSSESYFLKSYLFIQWLNWIKYENKFYKKFDKQLVLSEQDKFGLSLFSPSIESSVIPLPILDLDISRVNVLSDLKNCIGFVGAFNHSPNIEALDLIVNTISPQLMVSNPNVKILIAGKNPPIDRYSTVQANVEFLGFVESIDDFYSKIDIVIAPLISGGGVKIKVLEAFAFGRAVITTSIGIEGISARNNVECVVVEQISSIASSVAELYSRPDDIFSISQNAYKFASIHCSKQNWLSRFNSIIMESSDV